MTRYDPDFDGQKLMYHPVRVAEWLQSGTTSGPLYAELTLTDRCNCRCFFCGVDYDVNRRGEVMDPDKAYRLLDELAVLGNRAVMFCGNGEPLLHPQAAEIITYGGRRMSASVTTNGIALERAGLTLLDELEWIRFSVNGGTPEIYAQVHATQPEAFAVVLKHIATAVEHKRKHGLRVTIGVQLVLLDENRDTAVMLARRVKDLGVDYFSVKPYSPHPMNPKKLHPAYDGLEVLQEELTALETDSFRIVFRYKSFVRLGTEKPYATCYGTQFIVFVSANGDTWACNNYVGDRRFYLGNAFEKGLRNIWTDARRQEVVMFIENQFDPRSCRQACRLDACNRYLWRLKHPWAHDNFI
ncbi:MAG: radical SAM protein [Kiritimatiellia bacterium]